MPMTTSRKLFAIFHSDSLVTSVRVRAKSDKRLRWTAALHGNLGFQRNGDELPHQHRRNFEDHQRKRAVPKSPQVLKDGRGEALPLSPERSAIQEEELV